MDRAIQLPNDQEDVRGVDVNTSGDEGQLDQPDTTPATTAAATNVSTAPSAVAQALETSGAAVAAVEVTIGPQFLERFSEHLYSSPNKAFEELVANSWDAGARSVYVGLPSDLNAPTAAVWILDDGTAMDVAGLQALWRVAVSSKREPDATRTRDQIGKFGLGKLATYLLANELTYVSRASDGVIRAISMDYRRIDEGPPGSLAMSPISLDVRELDLDQLTNLLSTSPDTTRALDLINGRIPPIEYLDYQEEFGVPDKAPPASNDTWTLAVLTSLKPAGQRMQAGQIRRMLRTALPLGPSMAISFNDEVLASTKSDIPVDKDWVIGPGLGIEAVDLSDIESANVTELAEPFAHVTVEGVPGRVTGQVKLFHDRISGGKSSDVQASNGFEINIYGRVIRPADQYFGLQNLNHAVWSKFRATVRADGLDQFLAVNRETFTEGPELVAFRAFLRALFNTARAYHDAAVEAAWTDAGSAFTRAWSSVPLEPLKRVVSEGLVSSGGLPNFVTTGDAGDVTEEWKSLEAEDVVVDVVLEEIGPDAPLARYDASRRTIVVNLSHPFAREHSSTLEQKYLLRDDALVEILSSAFLLDAGVDATQVGDMTAYRDQLQRLIARMNRRTAGQIAEMLLAAVDNAKGLEELVGDALEYLGLDVVRKGQTGEPEGLATAPLTPNADDEPTRYSFTYDAKSTGRERVKAKDLNTAALRRHRKKYEANFTLVIAPDFEVGEALLKQAADDLVSPMRAAALAKLLMLAAATGPLDLNRLRDLSELHDPNAIDAWVDTFADDESAKPRVSLGMVLRVMADIGYSGPNAVTIPVIADRIRTLTDGRIAPTRQDLRNVVAGLAVITPSLVALNVDNVFLSGHPDRIRDSVLAQLGSLPSTLRFGLDADVASETGAASAEAGPPKAGT